MKKQVGLVRVIEHGEAWTRAHKTASDVNGEVIGVYFDVIRSSLHLSGVASQSVQDVISTPFLE